VFFAYDARKRKEKEAKVFQTKLALQLNTLQSQTQQVKYSWITFSSLRAHKSSFKILHKRKQKTNSFKRDHRISLG